MEILQKFFPSILFSTAKSIHLTFDDGPHPIATPFVLQELKKRNIRGTFFLLGQNAHKFPDLVKQIYTDGHQIGNHSHTHTNLLFRKKYFVRDEVLRTKELLEGMIGTHSQYFRPPYGYFDWTTMNVLRELGLKCVLWSVDSKDYALTAPFDISRRVIQKTKKGSILLFHDNDLTSQTVQSYLPRILDALSHKDFIFETLPV